MTTVGVLHPGAMGSAVAACVGAEVVWAGEGRSEATAARADAAGLRDVGTVDALVSASEIVLSICPPAVAVDVAKQVAGCGFSGIYVDANAVAPATVRRISTLFRRCVDGGIIGGPPQTPSTTRLYVTGPEAATVVELFAGSPLGAIEVPGEIGAASALKMAYAGWTKGSAALLLGVRALAEAEGVGEQLLAEWALSQPDLVGRVERIAAGTSAKAWRFAPEMGEIAATMDAAGLPDGFHLAAADLYTAMAGLKELSAPTLDDVLARLLRGPEPR